MANAKAWDNLAHAALEAAHRGESLGYSWSRMALEWATTPRIVDNAQRIAQYVGGDPREVTDSRIRAALERLRKAGAVRRIARRTPYEWQTEREREAQRAEHVRNCLERYGFEDLRDLRAAFDGAARGLLADVTLAHLPESNSDALEMFRMLDKVREVRKDLKRFARD